MNSRDSVFDLAMTRFDQANRADPNLEWDGNEQVPKELLYARRMSECLDRLEPQAPKALRLAARCQHICRWTIPRANYPEGRAGYRRWRSDLARFHAKKAGAILHEVGYDPQTIARVQSLVRKENLKTDPDTQTLEDTICLVFLNYYLQDFSTKHPDEKLKTIIRKTWAKMSQRGRDEALKLELPEHLRQLIDAALIGS